MINTINQLDIDAVIVAGDWTYEPHLDLNRGFAPFSTVKVPVFAVLGNHDVERPGPKLASSLQGALSSHRVQLLEGKTLAWKGWQISGLDDLWGGNPTQQIHAWSPTVNLNRIVIAHQPDTAMLLPKPLHSGVQLLISGHTHGGQVNLPWLTQAFLVKQMQQKWYYGLYQSPYGQIFVTTGTGMVTLPFRFRMMPKIDVLHINAIQ